MPTSSASATIARQWHLLKLIPPHGRGVTAAELQRKLAGMGMETSKRTIERDLVELDANFDIECVQDSKPYLWRWYKGSYPEMVGLTAPEALGLVMVEKYLRSTLPAASLSCLEQRFRKAGELLDALPRSSQSAWRKLFVHVPPAYPNHPPAIADGILDAIQKALLQNRCLQADYTSAGSSGPSGRLLHPLGLVHCFPGLYLVATVGRHQDPRLFALHRFSRVEILDQKAVRPPDFHLETFVQGGAMEFGGGAPVVLEAEVSPELAGLLRESPLDPGQSLTERGGTHHLKVTVRDSWRLQFWILSQGAGIVVKKPAAMRKRIQSLLQDALNGYR